MRALVILLAVGIAAPAGAQPHFGLAQTLAQTRDAEAAADALAARNREVALTNELAALEARAQSDRALSNLQAARMSVPLPAIVPRPGVAPPVDASQFASIPDATLARSNAAIRAAANNHR